MRSWAYGQYNTSQNIQANIQDTFNLHTASWCANWNCCAFLFLWLASQQLSEALPVLFGTQNCTVQTVYAPMDCVLPSGAEFAECSRRSQRTAKQITVRCVGVTCSTWTVQVCVCVCAFVCLWHVFWKSCHTCLAASNSLSLSLSPS